MFNKKSILENSQDLTKQEKEILNLLFTFRYLNQTQIQYLLNHKARERIRTRLNKLTEKNYLFKFYKKEFRAKPSEYSLDKKSRTFGDEKGVSKTFLKKLSYEKKNSKKFRQHYIFVAKVYYSLLLFAKKYNLTLRYYSKTELLHTEYLIDPPPDAFFHIQEKNKRIKRYFLDVFEGAASMNRRVDQYITYYNNQYWQDITKKQFPEVIFITPGERSKKNIISYIQKKLLFDKIIFYVTTKKKVEEFGMCSEILEKVEIE